MKKNEIISQENKGDINKDNSDYRYSDTNTTIDQPSYNTSNLQYGRSDIEDILKILGENNDHYPFVWTGKCKL